MINRSFNIPIIAYPRAFKVQLSDGRTSLRRQRAQFPGSNFARSSNSITREHVLLTHVRAAVLIRVDLPRAEPRVTVVTICGEGRRPAVLQAASGERTNIKYRRHYLIRRTRRK